MNDGYVTLAVVVNVIGETIALAEFPPYKTVVGDVACFENHGRISLGMVQNAVWCKKGDTTYKALVALYGREPSSGKASYTPFYTAGGEEDGN